MTFDVLDQAEGYDPSGGVTLHESALYATTEAGGGCGCEDAGCGTVFELTRGSGGVINEQVLHAFSGNGLQGALPNGVVVFDDRGDLFGVTLGGGNPNDCSGLGCGVVYGMKPQGNGNWAFEVLHTFEESDGFNPVYGLTIDGKGNLYGTTYGGGSGGGGVAFEISPTTQASK